MIGTQWDSSAPNIKEDLGKLVKHMEENQAYWAAEQAAIVQDFERDFPADKLSQVSEEEAAFISGCFHARMFGHLLNSVAAAKLRAIKEKLCQPLDTAPAPG
jgi:hypothetical protein